MLRYIIKKITYALLTLFGVVTVIFMLFMGLNADPAKDMLGQNQNAVPVAAVKKKYFLDKPSFTQYRLYLNDVSTISFLSNTEKYYTYIPKEKNHTI